MGPNGKSLKGSDLSLSGMDVLSHSIETSATVGGTILCALSRSPKERGEKEGEEEDDDDEDERGDKGGQSMTPRYVRTRSSSSWRDP